MTLLTPAELAAAMYGLMYGLMYGRSASRRGQDSRSRLGCLGS